MNLLFPIAEAAPLYKIGGLGDVGGALPKALNHLGIDVRIALPKHPEIDISTLSQVITAEFNITYHEQSLSVQVIQTLLPGTAIPVYLFAEPTYLSVHTDASDNHADKFAVFSLAVATWVSQHSPYWQPHVIHCHDWHTALIPVILKHLLHQPQYKTIITIHNLAYQGITQTPVAKHLNLDPKCCQIISWDSSDGDLNILLEGLLHCDFITTVSPTYAKEILTTEYGEKISHILENKKSHILGILNGIDTTLFNPSTDPMLTATYSSSDWEQGKAANRNQLRQELNLPLNPDRILIGFVGRIDAYQKGVGLIIQALNQKLLPPENTDFIFLGTGDPELEQQLHSAADKVPNCKIITRFDEPLAHRLYAGSHFSLIPSRFEPCGLVQLIAMRYGSLPIARATGGLIDTIYQDKNGFLFKDYNETAMMAATTHALAAIKTSSTYHTLVKQAMTADYSWQTSAQLYQQVYDNIVLGKLTIKPHD